ncbi:hypothetical protein IV203_029882 [Nitzschia inconspicua]|nr:hypothetical protein IV203_022287 [Nitzschia inconspicua]KAG7348157.1 hypothetical protein IV203_016862 [Nitzschia inconspicua]KAG7360220.1 hypothetical protein IV203_035319 [Nitzschia inconspicua]KAG7367211.1 hypothetical protein IV203_029882 [Nitzschia inconspicua]
MSCLAVDENEFLQLLIAFDEMSSSSSDEEEQKERPRKRPFKHRKSKGVVMFRDDNGELKVLPPTMSLWYNMYCQTGCQERMSGFHSKFRRRFRLPYDQYRELVEMCTADSMKEDGTSLFKRWRPGKKAALTGKPAAPLELLVLTTLRYLGRGWTFDDLEECTAISEEVIRVFFHQFIKFGSTTLYNKYVGPPLTVEDAIDLCIREYEAAGFPGCVGSMDASHVEHQRISFKHRQAHLSFKLPFTSRTYNIVTSHRRKIFSTTDGYPARWNDKTLVRYAGRAVDEEDYFQGSLVRDEDGAIIVRHMNMTDFRQRLITHFDIAFKKKEIIWPKARLQMDEPYANVQP